MTRILHISSSPKRERSASRRLADVFLAEYAALNPNHVIEELPLFETRLPEFGEDEITAKFSGLFGDVLDEAQTAKWKVVAELVDAFAGYDGIVLSTPMWNGSIPYALKHYIDILVQPHLSFGFDLAQGTHHGLLRDRPMQLILTRSSILAGDPADFQLPYLKYIFGFIGIRDVRTVVAAQTTRPGADERQSYLSSFDDELKDAARRF